MLLRWNGEQVAIVKSTTNNEKKKKNRKKKKERKNSDHFISQISVTELDYFISRGFSASGCKPVARSFVYRRASSSVPRRRLSLSSPGTHDISNPLVFRTGSTESSRVTHRGCPRPTGNAARHPREAEGGQRRFFKRSRRARRCILAPSVSFNRC